MAGVGQARIETLTPSLGDGINKVFSFPTAYLSASIRVFVNGIDYPPSDVIFGWSEDSPTTIEFGSAPLVGDFIEAFYIETDAVFSGDDVHGSPYAPGETC